MPDFVSEPTTPTQRERTAADIIAVLLEGFVDGPDAEWAYLETHDGSEPDCDLCKAIEAGRLLVAEAEHWPPEETKAPEAKS